jgi:hypothetical protein
MADTIWKTSDGREFTSEIEAQNHANNLARMKALIPQWTRDAREGDTGAMWQLVLAYEDDSYGFKDIHEAINWCDMLVQKSPNDSMAKARLEELIEKRDRADKDAREQAEWWRRAREENERDKRRGSEPDVKTSLFITVVMTVGLGVVGSLIFKKSDDYIFTAGFFMCVYIVVRRIMYAFYAGPKARRITRIVFVALTLFSFGQIWIHQNPVTTAKIFARKAKKTAVESTTAAVPTATVTAEALNMRAEPAGNAALVKTLKKGDILTVTGETAKGWTPVEHDGAKGYVSAQYIE